MPELFFAGLKVPWIKVLLSGVWVLLVGIRILFRGFESPYKVGVPGSPFSSRLMRNLRVVPCQGYFAFACRHKETVESISGSGNMSKRWPWKSSAPCFSAIWIDQFL